MTEESIYRYWISSVDDMTSIMAHRALQYFGSGRELYLAGETHLSKLLTPCALYKMKESKRLFSSYDAIVCHYEENAAKGIGYVSELEKDYPAKLRRIPDPPIGLFFIGHLPSSVRPAVSIIGARDCTTYGKQIAMLLGAALAKSNIQVISGMARGIDGCSQKAAVDAGGQSFGILGSGVDVCYPKENMDLYHRLPVKGGVLSTYPLGTKPLGKNFPGRNRIVSGLSDAVVVIEARKKSGTSITVDMALEQGKEVYAVPGRITDKCSEGCNFLISQGCNMLLNVEEFVASILQLPMDQWEDAGLNRFQDMRKRLKQREDQKSYEEITGRSVPEELQEVYELLEITPLSVEELLSKDSGNMHPGKLMMDLIQLCLEGLCEQVTEGYYVKRPWT